MGYSQIAAIAIATPQIGLIEDGFQLCNEVVESGSFLGIFKCKFGL